MAEPKNELLGWSTFSLVELDGLAPGLICRLLTASPMSRQSIFSVLAHRRMERREGAPEPDQEADTALARLLRDGRARAILADSFGAVQDGWLGALGRLGGEPMTSVQSYQRTRLIFSDPSNAKKAKALTHIQKLNEKMLQIIEALDDQWVLPQVLTRIDTPSEARDFSRAMTFAMSASSRSTEAGVVEAIGRLTPDATLQSLVSRMIRRGDNFPPHPLTATANIRPLVSTKDLIEAGCRYRNCLRTKLGEALSGRAAYAEFRRDGFDAESGALRDCILELRPLSDGYGFVLAEVHGHRNRSVHPRLSEAAAKACGEQGIPYVDQNYGGVDWGAYSRFMGNAEWLLLNDQLG